MSDYRSVMEKENGRVSDVRLQECFVLAKEKLEGPGPTF